MRSSSWLEGFDVLANGLPKEILHRLVVPLMIIIICYKYNDTYFRRVLIANFLSYAS